MEMIKLFMIGTVIGMANVIPGVSGGTLAVVFNIYDQFINAVTLNVRKLIENRKFVAPLLGGMAVGVLLFSKLITFLYGNFPAQTDFFFTGLIIGSLPLLFHYTGKTESPFPAGKIAGLAAAVIIGCAVILAFAALETVFDRDAAGHAAAILPELSAPQAIRLFIAGIVGAVAMVIPGISGSLLMLIMGVYTTVISAIPALFSPQTFVRALLLLLPNGIGVLIGLLCGAKLIGWILKKSPNFAYAVILGLLVGSAYNICPKSAPSSAAAAAASAICLAAGFCLAFFMSRKEMTQTAE